jgi:secreted PhoX family phosphatase
MTGSIYLNCTNNIAKDRPHGLILKFSEKNNNFLATEFTVRTFLKGGDETGFSCPDNLTFDHKGNLWLVSDMPVDDDASGLYKDFGNNSLFYIPMSGDAYGQVFRFASAPAGAELTGIVFAPDKQTLFCSIQHPTKEWPHGPGGQARSSVVAIQGSLIDKLLSF